MQLKASELVGAEAFAGLHRMMMAMVDLWNLNGDQAATLLGSGSMASPIEANTTGLQPSSEQIERFGLLLGIHKRLRALFPQNPSLAYAWVTTPNRAFENLTPVDVVERRGLSGILELRSYLDGSLGRSVHQHQSSPPADD